MNPFLPALRMLLVLTVLTGVLYPLLVTGAAQVFFPAQANGSLVVRDEVVVGSALMGQVVDDPRYFSGRPSAVNALQADAPTLMASGASNLSQTDARLQADYARRAEAFRADNGLPADAPVPPEMVMASGSGLDPHISPEAARLQAARVAQARGLPVESVLGLIDQQTEMPDWNLLGEPRVNVLLLNLALDALDR
ncbi:MAG: potassium-transporting ATPase subunit KdpC [Anaerolineae bacterium]|nr:potassium-transporting ATPase subunit KdpC [Anaerolineae bacterium]